MFNETNVLTACSLDVCALMWFQMMAMIDKTVYDI